MARFSITASMASAQDGHAGHGASADVEATAGHQMTANRTLSIGIVIITLHAYGESSLLPWLCGQLLFPGFQPLGVYGPFEWIQTVRSFFVSRAFRRQYIPFPHYIGT
jgi:hypothetical protein